MTRQGNKNKKSAQAAPKRGRPRLAESSKADMLGFTVTEVVKKAFEKKVAQSGMSKSEFFRAMVQTHLMDESGDGTDEVLLALSQKTLKKLSADAAKTGVSPAFRLASLIDELL